MTLAGSIKTVLYDNWSLTGNLAQAKVHFADSGWFAGSVAYKPQVVVSDIAEPIGGYFGGSLHLYPRYVVNCWLQIPRGAQGTLEAEYIENMRYEVLDIIRDNKTSIGDFVVIVPSDAGTPRHELTGTPRILRYEITLVGAHTK